MPLGDVTSVTRPDPDDSASPQPLGVLNKS